MSERYKLNFKASLFLKPEDMEEAIRRYLADQGHTATEVRFQLGTRTTGYYQSERSETVLEGAVVTIEPPKP